MMPLAVYMADFFFLKSQKLMIIIMIVVSSLTVYLDYWKWIVGTAGGTLSNRHMLKPLLQILHFISREAAGDGYAISEGFFIFLFIDRLLCKEGKWKQECILCWSTTNTS